MGSSTSHLVGGIRNRDRFRTALTFSDLEVVVLLYSELWHGVMQLRPVMGSVTQISKSNWQSGWNHIVYTMDGATHTLYWTDLTSTVTTASTFASGTDTFEVARTPQFSTAYQQILSMSFQYLTLHYFI